jgi:hypothetical protein
MDLSAAYFKRKRWEARLLAVEVGRLFDSGKDKTTTQNKPNPARGVPTKTDDILAMMGVQIKGA